MWNNFLDFFDFRVISRDVMAADKSLRKTLIFYLCLSFIDEKKVL